MTISQGVESVGGGMGGGLVPGRYPPPEAMRPTLYGDRWAVVAGHPLVSQVAAEVLHSGGNAVDAGVAAGLASNVVQVDMANFGGIAPTLVRPEGGPVYSVAGVGRWSRSADRAAIAAAHHGNLPLGGVPSIVPGAPSAWIRALQRFGTWSFADVAAPAIELARAGFPVDQRLAESFEILAAGYGSWPSSAAVYLPGGLPPRTGERLVQPALADLLTRLAQAERGPTRSLALDAVHDEFYRSDIAATMAAAVCGWGGTLTTSDFADFDAEIEPAPSIHFGRWQVHVTPLWSQGAIVTQALSVLSGTDLAALGHNSGQYLHVLSQALSMAFSERELHYGDGDDLAGLFERLHRPERIDRLRQSLGGPALPSLSTRDLPLSALRSTTSVVVVDTNGNAFGASPSDTLDGAPIIDSLGILCSPRGVQSRLLDDHPNALRPWRRPVVTPAPMMWVDAHDPGSSEVGAMACPGGDVIVQAQLQAFLALTVFGMTPQEAVEAPRIAPFNAPSAFHPHPDADNVVFAEQRISSAAREFLAAAGSTVVDWPPVEFDAGSVQVALVEIDRGDDTAEPTSRGPLVQAGADFRRSAYGIAR